MKIEIISGSPREESITRRVAIHLEQYLKQHSKHEIGLIDLRKWNLPALQTVFKSVDNTPDEFKPLSAKMFAADAFILVTPEYNGSYAPAMKNLLDHFPKQHRKAFGLVTASNGALGGIRATQQLLLLVPALFGIASPYFMAVGNVEKRFDPEGKLIDESFASSVHNFATEFIWLAERVATKPV